MWSGIRRTPDYELLLDDSRSFTQRGGEWNSYDYEVSQQWQGRFDELRVIGDKKGGYSPPCDWRRTRSYCAGCKVHVRNPALSAIVEDYLALLALDDLLSVGPRGRGDCGLRAGSEEGPGPRRGENRLEELRG
ncbi:MAG TPA: hypothetical protein VHF46_06105 [Rubrobacteraceae bacterium]|nr:hypothetical protein [Rubrobacteraceae bacterium]